MKLHQGKNMQRIFLVIWLVVSVTTAYWSFRSAFYNWDMLPYIATVYAIDDHDPSSVQQKTFEVVKETLPQSDYERLTGQNPSNNYRVNMASDPESFRQQFPFYTIKPLYIALVYLLYKVGINIVTATVIISTVSYWLITLLLFLWVQRKTNQGLWLYVASLLFMISGPMVRIARLSTPDALSTMLISLSLYLIFAKKGMKALAAAALLLSVLARPDNIIFVLMLIAYLGFVARDQYWLGYGKSVLFIAGILAVYELVNHLAHNYGWSVLFAQAFLGHVTRPEQFTGHVSIKQYLSLIYSQFRYFVVNSIFIIPFSMAGILALDVPKANNIDSKQINTYKHLVVISMLNIIFHYFLFPNPDDRFFISSYVLIVMCLVIMLGPIPPRQIEQ